MTGLRRDASELAPVREDFSGASSDSHLGAMWLESHQSEATRRGYRQDLAWWTARLPPGAALRELVLADLVRALEGAEGSPATIARRIATIRSLFRYAHRLGYVTFNVAAALPLPRGVNEIAERILEPDEVVRLLAAAGEAPHNGPRDHAIVRVLYVSGARVSELVRLDWEHVHPKDAAAVLTLHGKRARTRHVWITPATWAELATLATRIPAEGPIFRARTSDRLAPRDVQRVITRAAARAGLRSGVSPHWLRHAHATHALERGAPIHVVASCLGHESIATTTRYLHARPGTGSAEWLGL